MTREWTRSDLRVDPEIQIDDAEAKWINVYLETWFDCYAKFEISEEDANNPNTWVNLFAEYNPWTQELKITYIIDRQNSCEEHDYIPTENERKLVIGLIEEKVQELHGCSGLEWLKRWNDEDETEVL